MKIQLKYTYSGLIPDSEYDQQILEKLRPGTVVTAELKQSRNPSFHAKAFAMLHEVFNNQDKFDDFDKFRKWLQIAAGIVDTIIGPDGKVYYEVKSLSFANMDEIEFEEAYQALITAAYNKLGLDWVIERYA